MSVHGEETKQTDEEKLKKWQERQKKQNRELKLLKNENGTRAEQIARIQEKIKTLNAELAERKKEYAEMEKQVKDSRGSAGALTLGKNIHDGDINENKIKEKFNSLLAQLEKAIAKNYDEYTKTSAADDHDAKGGQDEIRLRHEPSHKGDDEGEADTYTKSNPMIAMGVKFLLEKEALVANPAEYEEDDESNLKGYVNTFRISNKTSFNELLTEACNFWGIKNLQEYELTDDKMNRVSDGKTLGKRSVYKAQTIENYFKINNTTATQYLVYLRKIPPEQSIADSKQATKIEIPNGSGEIEAKKKEEDTFKDFFDQFPGLKVFTIIPLSGERSIVTLYYTISSFQKAFGVSSDTFDVSSQSNTFQGIYRETDFYNFLYYTLATTLFYGDPSNAANEGGTILSSNSIIGGVRLRQMRVENRSCTSIPEAFQAEIPCYYMIYNDDIRATNQINLATSVLTPTILSFQNDWLSWQDAETLGAESLSGELASFDGSGYTVDIPWGTAQSDVQNFITTLEAGSYIALNTRAIVISFSLYNQVGQFFVYNEMVIEVLPTGILLPSKVSIIPFRTSFRTSATGRPPLETYDALRTICAILLTLFILYRLICSEGKFDLKYFAKLQGILNAFIVVLCFTSVGLNVGLGNKAAAQYTLSDYLTTLTYIEMKSLALGYESGITVMGIICGLTIARLATLLTMSSKFYMIITSLEGAWRQIVYYCIVFVPILFAFTVASMTLLGLQVESFNNFSDAFISILMFGFGQVQGTIFVGPTSSTLIVLLFTIFYFFVTFFLVTVFAGIYIDSYRVTVMDYGYSFIEKNAWTYSELLRWLIPKFFFTRGKRLVIKAYKKIFRIKDENKEGKKVNDKKQDTE